MASKPRYVLDYPTEVASSRRGAWRLHSHAFGSAPCGLGAAAARHSRLFSGSYRPVTYFCLRHRGDLEARKICVRSKDQGTAITCTRTLQKWEVHTEFCQSSNTAGPLTPGQSLEAYECCGTLRGHRSLANSQPYLAVGTPHVREWYILHVVLW